MKIHGMILCRNESQDRWLYRFMYQMFKLCDRIVILDDNSTDNTVEEIESFFDKNKKDDIEIYENDKCLWETNEVLARQMLFNLTVEKCTHEDWILCLDCDELIDLEHINYIKYAFKYLSTIPLENMDSLGFKLFDMWDDDNYRHDKWWTAHLRHWPMAIKYDKNRQYEWKNTKLHCGRFPLNSALKMYPSLIPIKHMGWSREKFRKEKYDRYMRIDGKKEDGLLGQYESILDNNPNLIEF